MDCSADTESIQPRTNPRPNLLQYYASNPQFTQELCHSHNRANGTEWHYVTDQAPQQPKWHKTRPRAYSWIGRLFLTIMRPSTISI